MNQNITDLQKRRADNIIWNIAKDYSFTPDFKAYDSSGDADIYWNIIYGSARRHYEYGKLEKLFAMLDRYKNAAVYEAIFWNALEPVLFRMELSDRPVLESIRPAPKETDLKFDAAMTTDEIVDTARRFFYEHYGLYGNGKIRLKYRLPHLRRLSVDSFLQRGRIVIHDRDLYHGDGPGWEHDYSLGTKLNESELRAFLETKFGKSIFPIERVAQIEKQLCIGNHKFTHLFYTRGEIGELSGIYSTFEMHQRKRQAELIANNRAYYKKNLLQNRILIFKLSISIMNSILLHMQPARVKASSGSFNPALAWRAARLGDEKVFTRTVNENAGDMSVDSLHTEISDIKETLDVNFIGTFALTKALMPLLTKNEGRIVNVTVPSEISPYWHPLAYVASKAAQNAMVGVMAIEFQQSNTPLEIFTVHPGPTTTDLNGNMALPGFHDIETVGQKMAELINDGQNHQGEFIELYPIVKED